MTFDKGSREIVASLWCEKILYQDARQVVCAKQMIQKKVEVMDMLDNWDALALPFTDFKTIWPTLQSKKSI